MGLNRGPCASAWWLQPLPDLLAELRVSGTGLTRNQARTGLKRHGANVLQDRRERALWVEFLRRFRNPLVLILIAASIVSAVTGEVASFLIISVMVLLSVTLDFIQEYRAGRAAQRLRQTVQVRATALRDGVEKEVPVAQVVPGNVVLLTSGSLVPADGRLLEACDLFVNQALLTANRSRWKRTARRSPIGRQAWRARPMRSSWARPW